MPVVSNPASTDASTPTVPTSAPVAITSTATPEGLKAMLSAVVEHLNKFVGKPNHNPFLFINENVKPLVARIDAGDLSDEVVQRVNQLHTAMPVPIINPAVPVTPSTPNPAVTGQPLVAPKLSPTGLNLPSKQ